MTTPSQDALIEYAPSRDEEVGRKLRLNNVTFELREDDGRFIVDVRVSRDGGKPVTAGTYTSYPTIEKAIERGLEIAGQYLKPTPMASDDETSDDDEPLGEEGGEG